MLGGTPIFVLLFNFLSSFSLIFQIIPLKNLLPTHHQVQESRVLSFSSIEIGEGYMAPYSEISWLHVSPWLSCQERSLGGTGTVGHPKITFNQMKGK